MFLSLITILNCCVFNRHPCRFKVNRDYIKTNCTLYNGLVIKKLRNVTKIEKGIPIEYEVEFKARYGGSGEAFTEAMDNDLNKIFFKKEIKGYKWIWHGKNVTSPIMPFDFEINNWYTIGELYEHGAPSVVLYIYVKEDGSLQAYRKDTPTNW